MFYSKLFTKDDNITLLQENDILKQPDLARTLRSIAERTPDEAVKYFYNSEFTDEMVNEVNEHGGIFQKEDFINYEVNEYAALTEEFDELKIISTRAPSGGVIFNFILNILKGEQVSHNAILSLYSYIIAFGLQTRSLREA